MITQYKKLSEIEHVRARPGMYVGSTVMHTTTEYVYNESDNTMCKNDIEYNPAIIKLFSEILDNSIDEAKRNPQTLNTIKVDFTLNGEISIYDNGGIPVKMHDVEGVYIPELIFSNLRAGSNFNDSDDQALIGTHGLGSTLTNILSTKFIVETCDGKNYYKQEFTDGMTQKSDPKIKPSTNNHTKITFLPDYDYFKTSFTDGNRTKIIKRVVDAAANNTGIKFYLNGKRLNIKSFQDYITLFSDSFVYEENSDWKIGIGTGEDGFEQISFVNSVETYSGGTHVDYVVNQVLNKLREYFKKKYKYDVKPSDIKNHMQIFIACNINRPKFNSQTKELMISEVKDFKTTYEVSDKFIKQLLTTPLIDNIVDWLEAKRIMQEERDKEKENKTAAKANPKHVEKFTDASYKNRDDCILFLVEGNSAAIGIKNTRSDKMGVFPLRGKPLSCLESPLTKILNNKEFKNIRIITGLQIGVPLVEQFDGEWYTINNTLVNNNDFILIDNMYKSVNAIEDKARVLNILPESKIEYDKNKNNRIIIRKLDGLRFGKICLSTDQDLDGFHIRGLLVAFFYKFWPELFSHNVICILDTPLAKVTVKKKIISFYSLEELDEWRALNKNENYTTKYYKGLGTSSNAEWKENLSDAKIEENVLYVDEFSHDDISTIKLLFSKMKGMANHRKLWLDIE